MINTKKLFKLLSKKIKFFTGVPDSVLKDFLKLLPKNKKKNLISVNEGTAVSHAIGYYLSTKKLPLVYMQNSGLGNAINPLISIASEKVYQIPMCILLGWRGSPKSQDEPQHLAMGEITTKVLKLLNIKYLILNNQKSILKIHHLLKYAADKKKTVCIIIKKNSLQKIDKFKKKIKNMEKQIKRIDFIETLIDKLDNTYKIISTTGYTSRELYHLRKVKKTKGDDFYMVGGMGHSSSVSAVISMFLKKKKIICVDGDGSILMHLGSMHTVGILKNKNFKHIIFNNNSHESVGGQPTSAKSINFDSLSNSLGYNKYYLINSKSQIKSTINKFLNCSGPALLEVKIVKGTIENLLRPKKLKDEKDKFMSHKI